MTPTPGAKRPRPVLGLVVAAMVVFPLLCAPAALVGWRVLDLAPHVDDGALDAARAEADALATVARAVEGLRGLARQIRHAPAGSAGEPARQRAVLRFRVLATDPAWRAGLPAAFGTALDEALASVDRLAAHRDAQTPWATLIADRLSTLDRFAAAPRDGAATPRARQLGRLGETLALAARARAPALSFLDREARRLAARAIAAPGLPAGLDRTGPLGSGIDVHAAIADALDIPAARRAALLDQAAIDRLWQSADGTLTRAADLAHTAADARLAEAHAAVATGFARLQEALIAALLAVLAVALGSAVLAGTAYAAPLGRLGRRAEARAAVPAQPSATSDRDAATLRTALLGAATEAAAGRALAATAPLLAQALPDDPDAAARVASALGHLTAAPDTAAPPLDLLLEDILAVLGQRSRARGVDLTLACPPDLTTAAHPGLLAAVIGYAVESVLLRVDGPVDPDQAPSRTVSVSVQVDDSGGTRLTMEDDGSPLSAVARDILAAHAARAAAPVDPATLAEALRAEPDAAALLLADGLARAGLGRALELTLDTGHGPRVTLPLA